MWFTAEAGQRKESRADEKHPLFPVKSIGLRPKSVAVIRINECDTETNHFPCAPCPTGGEVLPYRSSLKSTLMHGYTSAMHGHECVILAIVKQLISYSRTTKALAHLRSAVFCQQTMKIAMRQSWNMAIAPCHVSNPIRLIFSLPFRWVLKNPLRQDKSFLRNPIWRNHPRRDNFPVGSLFWPIKYDGTILTPY